MTRPRITVVGSVNLDLVATARTLPAPGETVIGASLARYPGGKGANQALAAQRLGADVSLIARVGRDGFAEEALRLLMAGGVDLSRCIADEAAPTGAALIAVADDGENQIVVASGANVRLSAADLASGLEGALILQLEVPLAANLAALERAPGFACVNLAPAAEVPNAVFERADLIVVNEGEAAFYGARLHRAKGRVAVTYGAKGAALFQGGVQLAEAQPPRVTAVDATGAGDAFVAALTLAHLEERSPTDALAFACAAGALAATQPGAQPALPYRAKVEALLAEARG